MGNNEGDDDMVKVIGVELSVGDADFVKLDLSLFINDGITVGSNEGDDDMVKLIGVGLRLGILLGARRET